MADAAPGNALTVKVPAAANLEAACSLATKLAKADHSAPLKVDAADVATMSTPYVLTLISAINSRPADAPRIVVSQPTPPFLDAFSDLGLFSDLMKMEFAT